MLLEDFGVKYSDHTLSSHCVCVGGLLICAYICGWTSGPVLPQQHSAATACTLALHPRGAQTFISTTTYGTSVALLGNS